MVLASHLSGHRPIAQDGWESDVIGPGFEQAQKSYFVVEGFCKHSWVSPSGKFRVRVFGRLDLKSVELFAVPIEESRQNRTCPASDCQPSPL